MALTGPDFQNAVGGTDNFLLPKYGQLDWWVLFPHALGIATKADGAPDFQLDLIRSRTGNVGYGVVDLRVAPILDLAGAQKKLGSGTIEEGYFSDGWLRLLVREPAKDDTATVLPPVRIASNGVGVARLAAQMSTEGISLLKRTLLDKTVLLQAWAEMSIEGVSPRLSGVAEFDAGTLADLLTNELQEGSVSRSALVVALNKIPSVAALAAPAAEAVADRLLNVAGKKVPCPVLPLAEFWQLDLAQRTRKFRWNLNEPAVAARTLLLRFDPVDLLEKACPNGGLDRLIVLRELPEFETGFVSLLVTANLVDVRSPVLSCGVDVVAPPKLPFRAGAIRETVEFVAPDDRKEILLRFAPGEPVEYETQAFVIVQTDGGIQESRSTLVKRSGADLRLSVNDFPARFIPVEASHDLLGAGAVSVMARWATASQTLRLDASTPSDAFVIDRSLESVTFEVSLKNGDRQLHATLSPAPQFFLDFNAFAEYGSHNVEIDVDFTDGPAVLALEFKPEAVDGNDPGTPLSFTPERARRTWTWFAPSPLAAGYRFRVFKPDGGGPWSEPQSPFAPLKIKAKEFAM